MHGEFEQLFVVFAAIPTVSFHLLDVFGQRVGIGILRHAVVELEAVFLGQLHDFGSQRSGKFAGLAENHAPAVLVNIAETGFALCHRHNVHQGDILGVLAEGGHQGRITEHGPDKLNFLEELHQQVVERHFRLAALLESHVDGVVHATEVGHHRPHHAARQTAADEQRAADFVLRVDIEAEEVVDKRLGEPTGFHIGVHVDIGHHETGIFQHGLHGDDIGMHHTPRQGFHSYVDNVGTCFGHFEGGGHRETGAAMAVVLHLDMGMTFLDFSHQASQRGGTSDASHILEGDFVGTVFHQLVHQAHIVFHRVNLGVGDAQGGLGNHTGFLGVFDREFQIAVVVQSAERTHDVHTLCLFDFRHQLTDVGRDAVHTEAVQRAFEHVTLDTGLVELLGPGTYCLVGVLAVHQVHLFESASVGLHTGEAAHVDDDGSNLGQLVNAGLIFS